MRKHTPGPWTVDPDGLTWDTDEEAGVFARVRINIGDGLGTPAWIGEAWLLNSDEAETMANARLIAKAPELAEFAEFVRDACVRLNDARAVENGDQGMLSEELEDMEQQAAALLRTLEPNP